MDLHFLLDEKKFDNPTPANNKESFNNITFPDNKNSINPVLDENTSLFKIYEDIFFTNNEPLTPNNTHEDSKEKNKIEKKDKIKDEEKKFLTDKKLIEDIQIKIRNFIYTKRPFKEKKEIGRNKKEFEGLGEHNKYSDDNIIRKIKHVVLDGMRAFINEKLKILYAGEDKEELSKKFLYTLKQNQTVQSKVDYNKQFLSKTIREICSGDISSKYSRHPPSHNKDLIESLCNDKDPVKKEFFNNIFNLSFVDCLSHFRGSKLNENLNGLIKLEEHLELEKSVGFLKEDYFTLFRHFVQNFEKIIMEKKPRIRIKKTLDDVLDEDI